MLIPLRHIHAGAAGHPAPNGSQPRGATPIGQPLAVSALRGLPLLLAALWWIAGAPAHLPALLLALAASAASLTLDRARPLPPWAALLPDAAAIGLLLHATGDAASPFLALTLTLVAIGWLSGGSRDALMGGGAGLVALLLVSLIGPDHGRAAALAMAAAQVAVTLFLALMRPFREPAPADPIADRRRDEAVRALGWQRLNRATLSSCDDAAELERRAAERAATISGAHAAVDLSGALGRAPEGDALIFSIAIAGARPGRLVVYAGSDALDHAQREALEDLTELTGMRAAELLACGRLQRQQDAMLALWEAAGMVRAAPGLDDTLRDACRRIARALDLDWLAVLGPNEQRTIAPLLVVAGQSGEAPRLDGSQLRVAAEAMRAGRPLVRSEGRVELICLPMHAMSDTPLVLMARGGASEAGTQALLMVFGDLVAASLSASYELA